jgi:hypothetical protein
MPKRLRRRSMSEMAILWVSSTRPRMSNLVGSSLSSSFPDDVAHDVQALGRFQREAKAAIHPKSPVDDTPSSEPLMGPTPPMFASKKASTSVSNHRIFSRTAALHDACQCNFWQWAIMSFIIAIFPLIPCGVVPDVTPSAPWQLSMRLTEYAATCELFVNCW